MRSSCFAVLTAIFVLFLAPQRVLAQEMPAVELAVESATNNGLATESTGSYAPDDRYAGYRGPRIVWPTAPPDLNACRFGEYYEPADVHLVRYAIGVSSTRVLQHDECRYELTRMGFRWILRPAGTVIAQDSQGRDLYDYGYAGGSKCANPTPFGIPIVPPTPVVVAPPAPAVPTIEPLQPLGGIEVVEEEVPRLTFTSIVALVPVGKGFCEDLPGPWIAVPILWIPQQVRCHPGRTLIVAAVGTCIGTAIAGVPYCGWIRDKIEGDDKDHKKPKKPDPRHDENGRPPK